MKTSKIMLISTVILVGLSMSPGVTASVIVLQNGLLVNGQSYSGTYDGMTNQGDPNRAYGGVYWPLTVRASGANMQCTALFRFANIRDFLPSGFIVQSARVGLTAFYGVSNNINVKVSEMLKQWNNVTMTWNSDGFGNLWAAGGGLGIATNGSIAPDRSAKVLDAVLIVDQSLDPHATVWFDIDPNVVQKWVYNENLNYGLVFYSDDGTNNTVSFVGRIGQGDGWEQGRPQLEITGFVAQTCAQIWANGRGVQMDLNHDCYINFADFAIMASSWLNCNDPLKPECSQ